MLMAGTHYSQILSVVLIESLTTLKMTLIYCCLEISGINNPCRSYDMSVCHRYEITTSELQWVRENSVINFLLMTFIKSNKMNRSQMQCFWISCHNAPFMSP